VSEVPGAVPAPDDQAPVRVQAVCWDLGGVLLRTFDWSKRRAWEVRLGLHPGALERRIFDADVGRRAMLGQATAADVWDDLARSLGLSAPDRDQLTADFFSGDRLDADLMEYIAALRARVRTGLISNAWAGIRQVLGDGGGETTFHDMVISAEVGLAKPDPAIFRLAIERLNVPAAAALFIDDLPANLEAARVSGLRPILFNGTRRTIEAVNRALES
jgi:putative hydrolase of the HAD superfamily